MAAHSYAAGTKKKTNKQNQQKSISLCQFYNNDQSYQSGSVTGNGDDSCEQLSCYSFASAIQLTIYFQIMLKTLHHVALA